MATDNPKALKHYYQRPMLERVASALEQVQPGFPRKSFLEIEKKLLTLEMKERVQLIQATLRELLPASYLKASKLLVDSIKAGQLSGFELWPYTQFVQEHGLEHPKHSLKALKVMTVHFTSEFGIRPFLREHLEESLSFLTACAGDKNHHVRRWASEGTRPRLPWGEKIASLEQNPELSWPILDALKFDPELYVRKSVANHLNDHTKHHADWVLATLKLWRKQVQNTEQESALKWIERHALRTLIKAGHPGALTLMGAKSDVPVEVSSLKIKKNRLRLGEELEFSFDLCLKGKRPEKLVIDYVLGFLRGNGEHSAKVFKLQTLTITPNERVQLNKKHSMKKITTRRYYSGKQFLEVQVNGIRFARTWWSLNIED